MNALTIISLQFKKLIDKITPILADLTSLKKRVETIESSPLYTGAGRKEEFIVLTKEMFNSNGYPYTEKPIQFRNTYTSPIAKVYINYSGAETIDTTMTVYQLKGNRCSLRYGIGKRPAELGKSYRAILHVQESGTDPALFKRI